MTPVVGCDTDTAASWRDKQQRYWDGISDRYDQFYAGRWSRRENSWVEERLSAFLGVVPAPSVLDLGCGTGLGLKMVQNLNPYARYVGVDVSPQMLATLDVDGADELYEASMDDLHFLDDKSFNVVLSLFSSISYACDTAGVFREVSRLLAPEGYAYLSVLSERALSRARSRDRRDFYRTRGDDRPENVPVRLHTVEGVRQLCAAAHLKVEWMTGMNLFSGVVEWPWLWRPGRWGAERFPDRAHTIELLVRKEA
ncbi:class I SAM-dependent methyltransferase [Phytohabitans sp. ZYX-F-186]|uniref:Class I SAM-dependent methyltransferase n=1 Tax=Phytohabitans maris TaxID=3071409 RepID=A0ABU0ZS32_9ACTN|nr:class I SAM-dependent methyltransferase [Phytohabitans sp. ZYX-F-186]MDQ7909841.1 class I SAM-dependent methyltransferase [Phytohabitans sp. ZYX-F-186]